MIPDFFQLPETTSHLVLSKTVVGLLIVLFASLIGVEIRFNNEDEET